MPAKPHQKAHKKTLRTIPCAEIKLRFAGMGSQSVATIIKFFIAANNFISKHSSTFFPVLIFYHIKVLKSKKIGKQRDNPHNVLLFLSYSDIFVFFRIKMALRTKQRCLMNF